MSSVVATVNDADTKRAERLKKLRDLHIKRNEARANNHQEVIEEDKLMKLPSNWEARQRKAEWLLNDDKLRQEAKEKGQDYNRLKLLNMTAMEADAIDRKKNRKNPDPGFSDYEQATARQYNRMITNFKVDMDAYKRQKEKLGGAFYAESNTYLHDKIKDSKEGVDRMVDDLEKQIAKRQKFSRRRTHNDEADIDYINERNMKFNAKLERYYGEHTTQIKQNLERGTAI
ncbi:pre-mRNA-splicing factor Syf2 [Adelges cooleyi]|uniref:pre-mRNA-splicing factor Syf2 n=1 Tax=Adelges cooleyi TaxID=133065 RepID=UPI00217F4C7B|nr:pre-mRNA-splicing factor Syf2 [Adelges cooleyi]